MSKAGGVRPGAGRKRQPSAPAVNADATPLTYMLAVMRDSTASAQRRDRMALAAAPFMHRRLSPTIPEGDEPTGKKEQAKGKAAKIASSSRLATPPVPPKLALVRHDA